MQATDIISVNSAKEWLTTDDTSSLDRLIKSAIDWVEIYTGYTLFQREVNIQIPFYGYGISKYPLEIISVKDKDGNDVQYTTKPGVYNTYIYTIPGSYLKANIGYASVDDIPPILVEGAYKMLTYLYENRDIYNASGPLDIQRMLNKSRRNLV